MRRPMMILVLAFCGMATSVGNCLAQFVPPPPHEEAPVYGQAPPPPVMQPVPVPAQPVTSPTMPPGSYPLHYNTSAFANPPAPANGPVAIHPPAPVNYPVYGYPAVGCDGAAYFGASCCGGAGCGGCAACCHQPLRFFASVEATFLRPKMYRPNASGAVYDGGDVITARAQATDIDAFYATPRITLGVLKGRTGVVGRFWQMEFSESEYRDPSAWTNDGVPTLTGVTYDSLDLDVYAVDVELAHRYQMGATSGLLTIGPRYIELESEAYAHASDIVGGDVAAINTMGLLHYDGVGVTGGINGSKAIRGGWSLFWSGRASGIFGRYFERLTAVAPFGSSFGRAESIIVNSSVTNNIWTSGSGQARANSTAPDDSNLFIFEGQVGVRYSQQLTCIPAVAFVNFGVEFQYWDLPDAYVDVAVAAGTVPLPGQADQVASRMELFGFNLSTGISF